VALEQRLQGGLETELVERGGPQLGDDRAQVCDLLLDLLERLVGCLGERLGVARRRAAESSTRSPPRA